MPSAVAGIVDQKGRLRVIVSDRWRMEGYLQPGERLILVPDLFVDEPVSWDLIPAVIARVQRHVIETLAPVNYCGGCNACCKIPLINDPELVKPSGHMCRYCIATWGCSIYQMRPKTCSDFECNWLKSQRRNDRMPLELRPDKMGAFFTDTDDPLVFNVHGEPNADGWAWINEMQRLGYKARKVTHYDNEQEIVRSSKPVREE